VTNIIIPLTKLTMPQEPQSISNCSLTQLFS